mgnify:CR=1 FL=1
MLKIGDFSKLSPRRAFALPSRIPRLTAGGSL